MIQHVFYNERLDILAVHDGLRITRAEWADHPIIYFWPHTLLWGDSTEFRLTDDVLRREWIYIGEL